MYSLKYRISIEVACMNPIPKKVNLLIIFNASPPQYLLVQVNITITYQNSALQPVRVFTRATTYKDEVSKSYPILSSKNQVQDQNIIKIIKANTSNPQTSVILAVKSSQLASVVIIRQLSDIIILFCIILLHLR